MDKFQYELELTRLNVVTVKTRLNELISKYRRAYDPEGKYTGITVYTPNSSTHQLKHNYLLYKRALELYKELGYDVKQLPMFVQVVETLNIQVNAEDAIAIMEYMDKRKANG